MKSAVPTCPTLPHFSTPTLPSLSLVKFTDYLNQTLGITTMSTTTSEYMHRPLTLDCYRLDESTRNTDTV